MRLQGRVGLVTGAGSGIGRATALRFAEEGAAVVVADVNAGAAQETVGLIEAAGGRAVAAPGDVSSEADAERFVADTLDAFGRLDILANVAGVIVRKSLESTTLEDWQRVLAVNLTGVFLLCRSAAAPMKHQRSGAIVNVASITGLTGVGHVAYAASKGGVISLTRLLASELGDRGIRVNAIAPGGTDTPLNEPVFAAPGAREAIARQNLLGRIARPEEMAAAAAFLASDDASFVTGHILVVDGGLTASVRFGQSGEVYRRLDESRPG